MVSFGNDGFNQTTGLITGYSHTVSRIQQVQMQQNASPNAFRVHSGLWLHASIPIHMNWSSINQITNRIMRRYVKLKIRRPVSFFFFKFESKYKRSFFEVNNCILQWSGKRFAVILDGIKNIWKSFKNFLSVFLVVLVVYFVLSH